MDALKAQLAQNNQDHVFQFWDELTGEQKQRLQGQLGQWDLTDVCLAFTESMADQEKKKTASGQEQPLQPLPSDRYLDRCDLSVEQLATFKDIGLKAIREGQVAVVVLAGGQGTRLGFDKPKGMYDLGLPSGKSLFQIQVERLIRLQRFANESADSTAEPKQIHLFVMTSPATDQTTKAYFEQQKYFGLEQGQVHFVQQAVMPCFSLNGQLLLAERDRLAESPDGNGGLYTALARSGALNQMRDLGVTHVHVYCVDNVLVRVADPAFVGFAIQRRLSAVAKAVDKRSADEPVGVFGLVDDRLRVLEYSEISREQSEHVDSNGRLTHRFGNICNHLFTVDFLQTVADARLPQHVALKKIPHLDLSTGSLIKPEVINGVKLEKFIFDVFELTRYLSQILLKCTFVIN
jgi:UDP-N-acetylglucosamine/UDP-N-acetylgalactosamine diphosphorylase